MRSFYSLIISACFVACQAGSTQTSEEVVGSDPAAVAEARAQTAREILDEQFNTLEGYVIYACAAGSIPEEQTEVAYTLRTTYVSCSVYSINTTVTFVPNPDTDGMFCAYLMLNQGSGEANFVLEPLDGGVFTAMSVIMPRVDEDYGRQAWVQQAMYASDGSYTFSADLQQRKESANHGPHFTIAYRQAGQPIPTPKHVSEIDIMNDVLRVGSAAMSGAEGAVPVFPLRRDQTVIRYHDFNFDAQEVNSSTTD